MTRLIASPALGLSALVACCLYPLGPSAAEAAYPEAEWSERSPAECGMDGAPLDLLADALGGRGCVIKDGYLVKSWGDPAERGDWYSSAKPVLSTLLFFAIEEGLVKSVDEPIADFGWPLEPKHQGITFRHLGSMGSGYARPEGAGEAWAYNDYAIQLYQMTLFDKVFGGGDPVANSEAPQRFGALGFQDGLQFTNKRRLKASVRDFARIVWLWTNHGRWGKRQVLPARYFEEYMRPQAPKDLPQTAPAETDDYLGIGTYGGESDHFSQAGPGIYGFNWWFNDTGRLHPHALTWPDAPRDTVMSLGSRGNCSAFIPSLKVALVCANGDWGEVQGGDRNAKMNKALKLLAQACGYKPDPVLVTGERRKWRPVTLSFCAEDMSEAGLPNPFTDCRLNVAFSKSGRTIAAPGYYAADGNALQSGGEAGPAWRVHFAPPEEGIWRYDVSFRKGPNVATDPDVNAGRPTAMDGLSGTFEIAPADLAAPGFLAKGTLKHTGGRYLQFAETGERFIKGGADSPENFLAFADFDGTKATHRYEPHAGDWRFGDPVWRYTKGKNIVGALNYLAGKGMNSVYFLTMNVEGDGRDVWPWTSDEERFRFDCSKLDQWEVVFSHMDRLGLLMHVVLQEQENDQLLDGGELGPQRRLYLRELIARFAHHPALVWNLGEENTNTPEQRRSFADYIRDLDPYDHPIAIHTFPNKRAEVYSDLLGYPTLDGPSLQLANMRETHAETLKWVAKSNKAGRPWFVCLDEIGPPDTGVKPDSQDPNHDDVRRYALWGNLMAGGAGCEWFFQNDVACEDWRSRERMWDQTRFALELFRQLPFWEMAPHPEVVAAEGTWCFAKPGEVYVVYCPPDPERTIRLDLSAARGAFRCRFYDPRTGQWGSPQTRNGGRKRSFKKPTSEDWVLSVRKEAPDVNPAAVVLLDDDFTAYPAGLFSVEVGAFAEYHYLPQTAPKGPWGVTTYRSDSASQRAWKVIADDGRRLMTQTFHNKLKHTHPMLSAGDPLWQDYELNVRFAPEESKGRSGVVFRYHNDRCYYFFGVDGPKAQLLLVRDETGFHKPFENVMAETACSWEPGNYLSARIHVEGNRIRGELDNGVILETTDATFAHGGIALLSDIPTRYQRVTVRTSEEGKARLDDAIREREDDERRLQEANPNPVVWRKMDTGDFGAGRNLRFGDLDGDGQLDVVIGQVVHHGPKDRNSELSCLTALTFDGKQLWQIGALDPWKTMLSNDVAFQIHDLDGDGVNEIVYCMNQEIVVGEGATGRTKYKAPTPEVPPNTPPPYNKFPRVLGDCLFFCDVRGTGRDADVVVKDRYQSFWVLNDRLEVIWQAQCNTGHYPAAQDLDNDGKDEIVMGYSLFDDDGRLLWSLDDQLNDHADGTAIVSFHPEAHEEPRIFCAASDEGAILLDPRGTVLKHHYLGHVQNPGIADFRPDLPGLETVTVNFWGNQGIIHFYDAQGDPYYDFEPFHHGSLCLPINWTGRPGAYVVLSANASDGGLFDGWGRRVVRFPEDGHPDMCYAVLDVTGDCREEIVVWDPCELWVYTQDDNPKSGMVQQLLQNPLFNESNYQAVIACPASPEGARESERGAQEP